MIRLAVAQDLETLSETTESAVRIRCLWDAYGPDTAFLRFYTDGVGGWLSVMDGVGVFHTLSAVTEEWVSFTRFYAGLRLLHCDGNNATSFCASPDNPSLRTGVVLRFNAEAPSAADDLIVKTARLDSVYALLNDCFDTIAPFDAWYVDISHRLRHDLCHIAVIQEADKPISFASTVAETEENAILGQVATASTSRRKGYAGRCVLDLIYRTQGKRLYILPAHKAAEDLYTKLGFIPCGTWAELTYQ